MTRIPRIEPGGARLTRQTGQATKDIGMAQKTSKAGAAFANVAQQLSQKFETLVSNNEVAQSKNEARTKMRDLTIEQEQDTDLSIENQNSYKVRLEKIKEETGNNISMPYAKNEYNQWYDGKSLITDTQINNTFRKKHIVTAKIEMENTVKELGGDYISGNREMALVELDKEIAEKVELGFWNTKAEKEQYKKDTIKGWRLKEVDDDIENSENFVVDELEKGDKGVYADVDADVRKKKLTVARAEQARKIAVRRRQDKIQANAVTTDLTLKALDPEGTGVSFDELKLASKMKNSEGNQLLTDQSLRVISRLKVSKDKINAVAHPPTYKKLYDMQKTIIENEDDSTNFADVARFRNSVTEAVADGKLQSGRAKVWVEKTEQIFQAKLQDKELAGMTGGNAISKWFREAITKTRLSEKQQQDTFMIMNNRLMDKIEPEKEYTNEEINKMATDIWNAEVIKNYPEVLGSGGIPNKIATKGGGVVPVSPNSVNVKGTTKPKQKTNMIEFKAPDGKRYKTHESNRAKIEAQKGYEIV